MPKLEKIELSESEEFCKKLRKSVFETFEMLEKAITKTEEIK